MTAEENLALVRRLIGALQNRDLAELTAVLADDAIYHFPGRSALAGTYEGSARILQLFGQFRDVLGPITLTTHDVLGGDEHVVELAENSAERHGQRHEWRAIRVYHFAGGRISEIFVTLEDPYAFDAFVGLEAGHVGSANA